MSSCTYNYQYFNRPELSFQIGQRTKTLAKEIFQEEGNLWEHASIKQFFETIETFVSETGKKNFTIVDIGAQAGLYTLLAKFFPDSRWFAFEPFPDAVEALRENLQLNNITNVLIHDKAVGETVGIKTMACCSYQPSLNTLGNTPLRFEEKSSEKRDVICTTLDCEFYPRVTIDFIKIDTEGYEYFILKGGLQVLKRDRPILQLEWNPINMRQCGVEEKDLLNLLSSLGYKQIKKENEELIFCHSTKLPANPRVLITNKKRTDGFGAQFHQLLASFMVCEDQGYEYVYRDIESMEHNYENDPLFERKIENLMSIPSFYRNYSSLTCDEKQRVQEWNTDVFATFEANLDRYLEHPFRKTLQSWFWSNKTEDEKNLLSKETFNVAVHIRRPTIHDDAPRGVIPDEVYINLMKMIRIQYQKEVENKRANKPIVFHIFAQGQQTVLKEKIRNAFLNDNLIQYHLDEEIGQTFMKMVKADNLILSESSLSYSAALLSDGIIFYFPFWHRSASKWNKVHWK
jgi:FkbM family methyltransferase